MIGVRFHEVMRGSWHRLERPADEMPIEFDAKAEVSGLGNLVGDAVAKLHGTVKVSGLAENASFEGTLGLGSLVRERRLPYAFSFRGDDGRTYRFDGAKEVSIFDVTRTMTTLPAYLFDDGGNEVGRAVLHFDLRGDLLKFLRSWKPFWAR